MTDRSNLLRGEVLKDGEALPRSAGATSQHLAPPSSALPSPSLHIYENYGWLRGFGIIPSWGARIEDAWLDYDGSRMREEIAPAKLLHANCIRLWIEFTAWMVDPDKVTANFHDAVAAIGEAGMKVMPCLFNRWHDGKYDYGGTYLENLLYRHWELSGTRIDNREASREYVRALVKPLINDDRVLVWDLCNEPHAGWEAAGVKTKEMYLPGAEQVEYEWLADIARTVRECGTKQPVTIGTALGGRQIEFYADLCDVLCAHLYAHDHATLEAEIGELQALQRKLHKPLLVNECIPGAEDDIERGALAGIYNELLGAAGFGWMGWCLREGKAVATRRDRPDPNGLRHLGLHPWVLKNGKLRAGLEALTEKPKLMSPWQKV